MPGIYGIYAFKETGDHEQELLRMQEALANDKECSSGTYCDEKLGVYTGWYHKPESFSDCAPIYNEKKDIVLIYFGENICDISLFNELKSKNHHFKKINASYIVHMYEEYGEKFFEKLNGLYTGFIIDKRKKKCILFNDRFGMQKLFYHLTDSGFYFSSEAKAIVQLKADTRKIRLKGLAEHIGYGGVFGHGALYENVSMMPGASKWQFENRRIKKHRYFTPNDWEGQTLLENNYFFEHLKDTIAGSIPDYLRSNLNIAIELSDNVDTILLNSDLRLGADKYMCFAHTFADDSQNTDLLQNAALLNQKLETITVKDELLNNFHRNIEHTVYVSDGYAFASEAVNLVYNQIAKRKAPIKISGKYGNVLFKPLPQFYYFEPNLKMFDSHVHPYFHSAKTDLSIGRIKNHQLSFALFDYAPIVESHKLCLEQSQITVRNLFFDKHVASVLFRKFFCRGDRSKLAERLAADSQKGNKKKRKAENKKRRFGWMSSKKGVPNRNFKYFDNETSYALYRDWFKQDLSGYVREILLDTKTKGRNIFNMQFLEKMMDSHQKGVGDHTNDIVTALSIEHLYRTIIDP